jgi:hypothetical protein
MIPTELIAEYLAGAELLEKAVAGMTDAHLDARPIAGKWSTREVVCHLADCEILYARRMTRVISEDKPALANADPDALLKNLSYDQRSVAEELAVVRAIRTSMGRILKAQPAAAFERVGMHSKDGPLALRDLLRRVTGHVPHHVRFIEEKRKALR